MSTRATVWIKHHPDTPFDTDVYLYHHCDGDDLENGLSEVLQTLKFTPWGPEEISRRIVEMDDAYHEKDGIGWDSEYVYVINTEEQKLTKYCCGIFVESEHKTDGMTVKEEKTQAKYIEKELEFTKNGGVYAETLRFDDFQDKVHERAEKVREFATRMKSIIDDIGEVYGLTKEEIVMAGGLICGMYMKDGDNRVQ